MAKRSHRKPPQISRRGIPTFHAQYESRVDPLTREGHEVMEKCGKCGELIQVYIAGEPYCLRCRSQRDEALKQQIETDPKSPEGSPGSVKEPAAKPE